MSEETLCADTEYVLKETDILRNTSVETSWQIPHKYIGMTREMFLETMNLYAEHPPLSELSLIHIFRKKRGGNRHEGD